MAEPYEIASMGEIYQVAYSDNEGTRRACIYSDGQLRFSLPDDTPRTEVEKFIRVYALGVSDGKQAGINFVMKQIQEQIDENHPELSTSNILRLLLKRIGQRFSTSA